MNPIALKVSLLILLEWRTATCQCHYLLNFFTITSKQQIYLFSLSLKYKSYYFDTSNKTRRILSDHLATSYRKPTCYTVLDCNYNSIGIRISVILKVSVSLLLFRTKQAIVVTISVCCRSETWPAQVGLVAICHRHTKEKAPKRYMLISYVCCKKCRYQKRLRSLKNFVLRNQKLKNCRLVS